ncbi:MAG: HIT domain-containing protein [Candidatus Dependentiae bacterium]
MKYWLLIGFIYLMINNEIKTMEIEKRTANKNESIFVKSGGFLHTPWRDNYALNNTVIPTKKEDATADECNFCKELKSNEDDKYYIIERHEHNYVSLAHFPYTANGHVLILPKNHVRSLDLMSSEARGEMIEIITDVCNKYKKNHYDLSVGFNIGKSAGAGIPSHLHGHIVPYLPKEDTNIIDSVQHEDEKRLDLSYIYHHTKKLLSSPHIINNTGLITHSNLHCHFCSDVNATNDEENFVIKRYKNHLITLARQPYTLGHIMISPIKHTNDLSTMSQESRLELIELAAASCGILKNCMNVTDFNVGFNMSKNPAVGFSDHLNIQVMPRWNGDTSFIETIGGLKVVSARLKKMYKDFKKEFEQIEIKNV